MRFLNRVFRSIENPSVPLSSDDAFLLDIFGGAPSSSGMRVTSETSLQYSPVWRSVVMVASDVGKLPFVLYRRSGDARERATEHPSFRLMRRKPGKFLTDFVFKMGMQASAMMLGNSYALIRRDGFGNPKFLDILPTPRIDIDNSNGRLVYILRNESGRDRVFPSTEILHLRGLTTDGVAGISVMNKARESLGLGLAAQRYGNLWFKNGGVPSVVLESANKLKRETMQRLSDSWSKGYGGDNAHRVAVLEEGLKANVLSIKHQDAQLMELREHEVRQVANWFGVPPHKVGDTTRTSFSSLEQENQAYLDQSLDPWLANWESECWDKLLTEKEKSDDSHFFEFTRSALIRTNLTDRFGAYNVAINGGWMSRNEARAKENMNPAEGLNSFFVPKNMGLAGQDEDNPPAQEKKPPQQESQPVAEALRDLLADAARRSIVRMGSSIQKAAKKPDTFIDWIEEELEERNRHIVEECLAPVLRMAGTLSGRENSIEALSSRIFEGIKADLMEATSATPDRLSDTVHAKRRKFESDLPTAICDHMEI